MANLSAIQNQALQRIAQLRDNGTIDATRARALSSGVESGQIDASAVLKQFQSITSINKRIGGSLWSGGSNPLTKIAQCVTAEVNTLTPAEIRDGSRTDALAAMIPSLQEYLV